MVFFGGGGKRDPIQEVERDMFGHKAARKVEEKIFDYLDSAKQCMDCCKSSMDLFFAKGHSEEFDEVVASAHRYESKSDDLRREIEHMLYGKALLPESRGDILGLLETFDKIPNQAEAVLFLLQTQRTIVPQSLATRFEALVVINLQAFALAHRAMFILFEKPEGTLELTVQIDRLESESDAEEMRLITTIFSSDFELAEKIILRDIVRAIGSISDRCENLADRAAIVTIKRKI